MGGCDDYLQAYRVNEPDSAKIEDDLAARVDFRCEDALEFRSGREIDYPSDSYADDRPLSWQDANREGLWRQLVHTRRYGTVPLDEAAFADLDPRRGYAGRRDRSRAEGADRILDAAKLAEQARRRTTAATREGVPPRDTPPPA